MLTTYELAPKYSQSISLMAASVLVLHGMATIALYTLAMATNAHQNLVLWIWKLDKNVTGRVRQIHDVSAPEMVVHRIRGRGKDATECLCNKPGMREECCWLDCRASTYQLLLQRGDPVAS